MTPPSVGKRPMALVITADSQSLKPVNCLSSVLCSIESGLRGLEWPLQVERCLGKKNKNNSKEKKNIDESQLSVFPSICQWLNRRGVQDYVHLPQGEADILIGWSPRHCLYKTVYSGNCQTSDSSSQCNGLEPWPTELHQLLRNPKITCSQDFAFSPFRLWWHRQY